jgi:hypothetical protein
MDSCPSHPDVRLVPHRWRLRQLRYPAFIPHVMYASISLYPFVRSGNVPPRPHHSKSMYHSIRVILKPRPTQELAKRNNHLLRSRKRPGKSRFDVDNAAINLKPTSCAECTKQPPKRPTVNTDGRGCVVRSLNRRAKCSSDVIFSDSGGGQWPERQMPRGKG